MSTIVIVSICVAIAAVIGLRVYVEHKEEKEFEKLKQQVEEDKKNAAIFVQEEAIAVEQPVDAGHALDKAITNNLIFVDIEPVNSAAAEQELKPKKKKRYYHNKKKASNSKPKKQTKK